MITVKTDPGEFASYLEDTSNLKGNASKLSIPSNIEEAREVVINCSSNSIPLTISGSRTGTTAGSVPLGGEIISLEKLNKIIKIDKDDDGRFYIDVEAGLTLEEMYAHLKRYSLFFPPSPTEPLASVGGIISTCASGSSSFKYGSVRNWIKKIKVILCDGEVVDILRGRYFFRGDIFSQKVGNKKFYLKLPSYQTRLKKSTAGYFSRKDMDLVDLFIGAEGTLGLIVEAQLFLEKDDKEYISFLVFLEGEDKCLEIVEELRKRSLEENSKDSINVECIEFFDTRSLYFLRRDYPNIPQNSKFALFFEQRVYREKMNTLLDKYYDFFRFFNINLDRIWCAISQKERERLVDFRHRLPQILNEEFRKKNLKKYSTDIAVPWRNFYKMYLFYKEGLKELKSEYVMFGHIGDAHLHINIFPQNEEERHQTQSLIKKFCQEGVKLGGTVSGEHGIGKLKREFLKVMYSPLQLKEMALLKKQIDHRCIFNLDNIFCRSLLFEV